MPALQDDEVRPELGDGRTGPAPRQRVEGVEERRRLGVVGRGRSQLWRGGQYDPGYESGYAQNGGRSGTGMDLID